MREPGAQKEKPLSSRGLTWSLVLFTQTSLPPSFRTKWNQSAHGSTASLARLCCGTFLQPPSHRVSWSGAAGSLQSLAHAWSGSLSGTRGQRRFWKPENCSAPERPASPPLSVGGSFRWMPQCLRHFRSRGEAGRAEDWRGGGRLGRVAIRSLGDGAWRGRKVAGGGRAGACGRARPGGPHPGVPAPATAKEEAEDGLQIHSEGGATEFGAVSGLLSNPSWGRGRPRRTTGALGTHSDQSLALFLSQGRGKKIFFRIHSFQPCWTLPPLSPSLAEGMSPCYPRTWPCWAPLPERRDWVFSGIYSFPSASCPIVEGYWRLQKVLIAD